MSLGRVAIVNRPLREGEAVMGAWIDLDLGLGPIALHSLFHFLDDFRRRVDIRFRATEIEFGAGFSSGQMRAVSFVASEMRSIDRGGGLDAFREVRGRIDRISPAHA